MSNTPHAAPFTSPATIASAPLLPPRVRRILTTFFAHVSTDLGERINLMLLGGIPLAQWVIILNFAYIAVLLAYKLYRIWKEHRGR